MKFQVRPAVVGLLALALASCHLLGEEKCHGYYRCHDNSLEWCTSDQWFGDTYWHVVATCESPQVCRVDTAPGVDLGQVEMGCFDSNAYCPAGQAVCVDTGSGLNASDSSLWSCVLQESDQTLRWSRTVCSAQTPVAWCAYDPSGGSPVPACYEAVQNCPYFPARDLHCEGSVQYWCAGPSVIDGKAVFDWYTVDCAPNTCAVRDGLPDCATPP